MLDLITLAQQNTGASIAAGIMGIVILLIWLAIIVIFVAGMWMTFVKAGQPGWAAIIPIFNIYIMLKVAGRPGWWLILYLIPVVNLVVIIIVYNDIAKSFGHGLLMTLLLFFISPVAFCVIGFGGSQYQGPVAA